MAPRAFESLGELAYESGSLEDARRHFARAASFWTDDFPDAASVEARSYEGLIEVIRSRNPSGISKIQDSVRQARRMGRVDSEALCRVHLARVELANDRSDAALAALAEMADAGDKIGPELRAELHYWRAQAMGRRGRAVEARSERSRARERMRALQESLPKPYRAGFATRVDVRPVLEEDHVEIHPGPR